MSTTGTDDRDRVGELRGWAQEKAVGIAQAAAEGGGLKARDALLDAIAPILQGKREAERERDLWRKRALDAGYLAIQALSDGSME